MKAFITIFMLAFAAAIQNVASAPMPNILPGVRGGFLSIDSNAGQNAPSNLVQSSSLLSSPSASQSFAQAALTYNPTEQIASLLPTSHSKSSFFYVPTQQDVQTAPLSSAEPATVYKTAQYSPPAPSMPFSLLMPNGDNGAHSEGGENQQQKLGFFKNLIQSPSPLANQSQQIPDVVQQSPADQSIQENLISPQLQNYFPQSGKFSLLTSQSTGAENHQQLQPGQQMGFFIYPSQSQANNQGVQFAQQLSNTASSNQLQLAAEQQSQPQQNLAPLQSNSINENITPPSPTSASPAEADAAVFAAPPFNPEIQIQQQAALIQQQQSEKQGQSQSPFFTGFQPPGQGTANNMPPAAPEQPPQQTVTNAAASPPQSNSAPPPSPKPVNSNIQPPPQPGNASAPPALPETPTQPSQPPLEAPIFKGFQPPDDTTTTPAAPKLEEVAAPLQPSFSSDTGQPAAQQQTFSLLSQQQPANPNDASAPPQQSGQIPSGPALTSSFFQTPQTFNANSNSNAPPQQGSEQQPMFAVNQQPQPSSFSLQAAPEIPSSTQLPASSEVSTIESTSAATTFAASESTTAASAPSETTNASTSSEAPLTSPTITETSASDAPTSSPAPASNAPFDVAPPQPVAPEQKVISMFAVAQQSVALPQQDASIATESATTAAPIEETTTVTAAPAASSENPAPPQAQPSEPAVLFAPQQPQQEQIAPPQPVPVAMMMHQFQSMMSVIRQQQQQIDAMRDLAATSTVPTTTTAPETTTITTAPPAGAPSSSSAAMMGMMEMLKSILMSKQVAVSVAAPETTTTTTTTEAPTTAAPTTTNVAAPQSPMAIMMRMLQKILMPQQDAVSAAAPETTTTTTTAAPTTTTAAAITPASAMSVMMDMLQKMLMSKQDAAGASATAAETTTIAAIPKAPQSDDFDLGAAPTVINATADSLTKMGMNFLAQVGDAFAQADNVTEEKLFGTVDTGELWKPYGKPENVVINLPPVQLPPMETTRDGDTRYYVQVLPEVQENKKVVSNKLINTYSEQQKLINIHNRNTVQFLKTLNVNTDYVTNIQKVNHPKTDVQQITHIHNRYVPKLVVKHTRFDKINELPPQFVPTVAVNSSVVELPPIVEPVKVEREGYDHAITSAAAAAAKS